MPVINQSERLAAIKKMESDGNLSKDCLWCADVYEATDRMPWEVFMPPHKASSSCASGKRPHCSCGTCF